MIRFGFGTLGMLWVTGLLVAGCCPPRQSTDLPKLLWALQGSLDKLERQERRRATQRKEAGHGQAGRIVDSCGRLRRDLEHFRGYCPCKDQVTPLAVDLARAEVSLAVLSSVYGKKHPRMVALLRRIAVLKKYLRIHRANGQRVDHCRLLSYLTTEAYRMERSHAELSSRYLAKHPQVASLAAKLGVLRKALRTTRARCRKPRP